ncbi:MAG: hypothetical protein R3F43_13255 [bacterium]
MDGITQSIVGNARLSVGEEVVVFLTQDAEKGLHYVIGMAQGKYTVDRRGRAPHPARAGGAGAGAHEDGSLAELKSQATLVLPTLATFKASIRQAISAAP